MKLFVLDGPASIADAVASLPAAGPLPARTVLVPSERHAHALRRALARSGRLAALAGTRFVGSLTAALEVLRAAGMAFTEGEDALRPARLLALFRGDLRLEHFDPALLRSTRGWDAAFASAIGDLEAAGLSPADLPRDAAQARDLAAVWARVAEDAGASLTDARALLEAAALLSREARAWPFDGPTLALASGHEPAAQARFLAAVPGVALALRASRPAGDRPLERIERLYGSEARRAAEGARAPVSVGASATERDLLVAHLFADAKVLADPGRRRSGGRDGTADLEEHAGVEAELEAAAAWVSRQVLEARRPLEEIAVLVPSLDPLAQLTADRLERLPFEGGPLPVYVAGGLPAVATAAGARVLALLRALASSLSAETLAPVLPALRLEHAARGEPAGPASPGEARPDPSAPGAARSHLTHGEAMELAYGLGTVGGNAAHPEGALEWSARAAARIPEIEAALLRARADEDSAAREAWRLERMLENLRAIRPALEALVGVARAVVAGAPLAPIWEALSGVLERWLLKPGEGAALPPRLAGSLAAACSGPLGKALTGEDALEVIEAHLRALRVPHGRFGEPAVYVGTVQGAAGLDFEAVRVLGLCEGALPSQPLEDPVLPDGLRRQLEAAAPGRVLPRAEDRVAAQIHGLLAALGGARGAVALSAPRMDLARTEREPASLFIDAAAALARPDAISGLPSDPVPGTAALRRDYFQPAAVASAAFRAARPVSDASWLDRVARVAAELPPEWSRDPVLALERVEGLAALPRKLGPADGVLGPGEPFPPVPGLSAEKPISASALKDLVECPRMFLMKRILHWEEPASAPSLRELDARSYGILLHRAVEAFYRRHGAELVEGRRSLAEWQELARAAADRELETFLSEYPLVGEGIRAKERDRLREGVRAFVEYDWGKPGRRYVGVELPFGDPAPMRIDAGGTALHVRGFIDRVDVEGDATLVRDLKSGRSYPRSGERAGPTAELDVQLGLYQLAARELAGAWGAPRKVVAAYVYAGGRAEVEERAFRDDPEALERATSGWLSTAAQLLVARAFPPTADEDDCPYCPFKPLCGGDAARRAREGPFDRLRAGLAVEADGALAGFRKLKLGEEDEG